MVTPLAAAEKLHLDGTHRIVEPVETLHRLLPILPRVGITRVGVITGLDVVGIPVVMVCRPNGRSLSVSQGKGVDLTAAKVSGIMEALEGWHAEHVLLPLRLATYRELREVADVVDVEQLARPSWSRFHPDLSILWIEGTDVIGSGRVWVPYECVHLDFRSPGPQGTGCFLANGTGLAAGNHLLEAVSHALCEAVERDAFALWDDARRRTTGRRARVDLDTVTDPGCRAAPRIVRARRGRRRRVGPDDRRRAARLLRDDRRSPQRRPAAPSCRDRRRLPSRPRRRALARAHRGGPEPADADRGQPRRLPAEPLPPGQGRRAIGSHLASLRRRRGPLVRRTSRTSPGRASTTDVTRELDRLRAAGIRQVILVDLTRPEVGVPVVRMVVPGLEGWTDKVAPAVPGPRRRAVRET